jgi:hypothetical protein
LSVRMAFLNDGIGRAEVSATNGDLPPDAHVEALECWDEGLDQTHYHVEYVDAGGTRSDIETMQGELADCGALFTSSLDDLHIPSIAALWEAHPLLHDALYAATDPVE